jgi:trk system potassium uptake protein
VLTCALHLGHGLPWAEAAWSGLFHAVSAFNNAGFSLHGDSLMRYAGDAWVLVPVMLGIVIGGIGFPVLQDLRGRCATRGTGRCTPSSRWRAARAAGGRRAGLLLFEWDNPKTLGPMDWPTSCCRRCSPRCRRARRASTRSTSARCRTRAGRCTTC